MKWYFLAQGCSDSESSQQCGNHFLVDNVDIDRLFGPFDTFETLNEDAFVVGDGQTGAAHRMQEKSTTKMTESKPDIGFVGRFFSSSLSFTLSENGISTKPNNGTSSFDWMGYKFTVAYPVTVSALRGGAALEDSLQNHHLAIFELSRNGTQIIRVIAQVTAPHDRGGTVGLDRCIQLRPGKKYFIAQGCTRSFPSGCREHFIVADINMTQFFRTLDFLETWEPDDGKNGYRIDVGGLNDRKASNMTRKPITDERSNNPDIGFVVLETYPSPTSTPTGSPTLTLTPTLSGTLTQTKTKTPSATQTATSTPSSSPTDTGTDTPSLPCMPTSPSASAIPTSSPTPNSPVPSTVPSYDRSSSAIPSRSDSVSQPEKSSESTPPYEENHSLRPVRIGRGCRRTSRLPVLPLKDCALS